MPLHSKIAFGVIGITLFLSSPSNGLAADAVSSGSVEETLSQAEEHLVKAEYDEAIDLLQTAIGQDPTQVEPDALREYYLQLVTTIVSRANASRFEPQGAFTSKLYYNEAKEIIKECLSIKALRHTAPVPPDDFAPEVVDFFREVRGTIFGSFRVVNLEPADAFVYFDGERLRGASDSELPSDTDIPVGTHEVLVRAEGHEDYSETINISPNATLELAFTLKPKKGFRWWLTRGALASGVAAGVVIAVAGKSGGGDELTPLPGPPDPPDR